MARRLADKHKTKQQQMNIKDFNRNKKPRKNRKIPIDYNNKKNNNKTKICLNKYFSVNYTIYKNTNTKTKTTI